MSPQSSSSAGTDAVLRTADILFSAAGLIVAAPIVLGCMIAIRATSEGPAIFAQERVGRGKRTFTCYKLRTMKQGTRSAASHDIGESAVTPLGRFLRRVKLDELPQLLNVLKGEMSFVGPRPCLPSQHELIEARDVRGLYSLRPGITGPAQVLGVDMSDPDRLAELDTRWLSRSVGRYLQLIIMTGTGHGRGDRVNASA